MSPRVVTPEEEELRVVMAELKRRGELPEPVDPLERLFDPTFTETLWPYAKSQTEPRIPGALHEKQREVLEAEDDFKWLFWGNQVGKTTLGAVECDSIALGRHPIQRHEPPVTIWASALTWELWEHILLPELLTWLPPDRVLSAPPPKRQSTNRTILVRADNGAVSRIVGKSAEQGAQRYQSARIHHFWPDEEHPQSIYDEIQPRLLRHNGTLTCTMTPLLGLTWVYHRIYLPVKRGQLRGHFISHAGLVDNPSISPEAIAKLERELRHDPIQLRSRMYGEFGVPAGLAINLEARHFEHSTLEALLETARVQEWEHVCGIDFGYWRFAFVHCAADRAKRFHVLEEYFSQKESLGTRAQWIHDHLTAAGVPHRTPIWGDSANPQDILEINVELQRIGSPYRVAGVSKKSSEGMGFRRVGVDRILRLMERDAFLVRSDIGEGRVWRLGQSAASEGTVQMGSRLRYELSQWRYPKPKDDEEAQVQDPDDDTADGADTIAALRHAVVSWWSGAAFEPVDPDVSAFDEEVLAYAADQALRVTPDEAKRKRKRKANLDPLNTAMID